MNEILVQNGLFTLPDVNKWEGASKRKSEKHDVSSKKLKKDSDINTERFLADLDDMSEIKVKDILNEETSVKIDKHSKESTYDIEKHDKEDDERDPLACQICNLKKSTITILQQHYINSHYTRKLKDRYEQ